MNKTTEIGLRIEQKLISDGYNKPKYTTAYLIQKNILCRIFFEEAFAIKFYPMNNVHSTSSYYVQ